MTNQNPPQPWGERAPGFLKEPAFWTGASVVAFFIVVPFSVWWWSYAARATQQPGDSWYAVRPGEAPRYLLLGAVVTFIVGCLAGFVFTRRKLAAWFDRDFWTANSTSLFFLLFVAPVSFCWWQYATRTSQIPGYLLFGASVSSFMVGCLVGFVFTSYGEEAGSIGKIRDWVIGGVTGLTLAQATTGGGFFKSFLSKFTVDPKNANQFGLVLSLAIVYSALGFLFMFFQRELGWNPRLAKSRLERGLLDGSRQTTLAVQKLLVQLPASILTGVENIGGTDVGEEETKELKDAVYNPDVNTFLKQAEDAVKSGTALGWDDIYKVANIQYYRAYFETKDKHAAQVKKALEWITRALALNPLHADLTMKYADMLDSDGQNGAAIAVLENLAVRDEAPVVTFQWLGYYLRFVGDRLDDSIKYSNKFLALFPGDNSTRFNLAYAYGAKFCQEVKRSAAKHVPHSDNRAHALALLEAALAEDPGSRKRVGRWPEAPELKCLDDDRDFRNLAPKPPAEPAP